MVFSAPAVTAAAAVYIMPTTAPKNFHSQITPYYLKATHTLRVLLFFKTQFLPLSGHGAYDYDHFWGAATAIVIISKHTHKVEEILT